MNPTYFADFEVARPLDDVLVRYAEWLLGLGSDRARERRLALGIESEWSVEALAGGGRFEGTKHCAIDVRQVPTGYLIRFVHADGSRGDINWINAVHLRSDSGWTRIEHGIARTAVQSNLRPRVSVPSIVNRLASSANVKPKNLFHRKPTRLPADEVEDWVHHILADRNRELPVLVLSPAKYSEQFLVDPSKLAGYLRGAATVAALTEPTSTYRLAESVMRLGVSEAGARCFNGAARLFAKDLIAGTHRVWLAESITRPQIQHRTEALAANIHAYQARRRTPDDFFRRVNSFDLETVRKRAAGRPAVEAENADEIRAELKELRRDNEVYSELVDESEAKVRELNSRVRELESERDELENRLDTQKLVQDHLQKQLDETKSQSGTNIDPRVVDAFGRVLCALCDSSFGIDLLTALKAIAAAFNDRLIVLDSAYDSAAKAADFRAVTKAIRLLVTLATKYFDELQTGGDARARAVFSKDAFAATESETVRSNKTLAAARVFTFRGRELEMYSHLKIGVRANDKTTLRIHFCWDHEYQRLIVGHCGAHLPLQGR